MFPRVIEHTCLMIVRTERRLRIPRDRGENAKHETAKHACNARRNYGNGQTQSPKRDAWEHDVPRQLGIFQPKHDRPIGSIRRLSEPLNMARIGLLLMHGLVSSS